MFLMNGFCEKHIEETLSVAEQFYWPLPNDNEVVFLRGHKR